MTAQSTANRKQAFEAVEDAYFEWVDHLPHIYDTGDGGAQCSAATELKPLQDAHRELVHVLISHGEAALATRLDKAFDALMVSAKAIGRLVGSPRFRPAQWFKGDEPAQRRLTIVTGPLLDLVDRAMAIASEPLTDGWTRDGMIRHAAFWLAFNLRHRGEEASQTGRSIRLLLSRLRIPAGEKHKFQRSAIGRAYGRMALGYSYLAKKIGTARLEGIDAFAEELQLAAMAPVSPGIPPAAVQRLSQTDRPDATAHTAGASDAENRTDGCYPPALIVWRGVEHRCEMTKKEMAFLSLGLKKDQLDISTLMNTKDGLVWRRHYVKCPEVRRNISQFLSRLNGRLLAAKPSLGLSFMLSRHGDWVIRQDPLAPQDATGIP